MKEVKLSDMIELNKWLCKLYLDHDLITSITKGLK